MNPAAPKPAQGLSFLRSPRAGSALIWAAAAIMLALQISLVFTKSLNWDELFHFSQIHAALRGEHVQWLQTPYVRLFSWVPALPGSPIDHIILIRLLLVPFGLITALAIYDIARRFTDRSTGAIAALTFAGGGYVFEHSFALRADMIAAALCTAVLWIIATRPARLGWFLLAILAGALAFVATIKSVLYTPAFAAMLVWRFHAQLKPRSMAYAALLGLALIITALWALPSGVIDPIIRLAGSSFDRMFGAGLFPQRSHLLVQLASAPILTAGIGFACIKLAKRDGPMPRYLAAGLMLPLASVILYRNAYPYFFAFIMPPAAIGAALGFAHLRKSFGLHLLLLIIAANAALLTIAEPRDMIGRQRIVHDGIDTIFSGPTRFIDDIAFRPDFPRAVPHFASGWALQNYRAAGKPVYRDALEGDAVPFLFLHGYALENLSPRGDDQFSLLPSDAKALRENYIEHWGRVFVAGKILHTSKNSQRVEILIPGIYTVEGADLAIDGHSYAEGAIVKLARGTHEMGPVAQSGVRLRWGNHLPVPDAPFPDGPLFTNY